MKNNLHLFSIVTAFLLWNSNLIFCQNDAWTEAASLTDSITNNTNAQVHLVNLDYQGFYVFWEMSENDQSTSIYHKDFYGNEDAEIFLHEENVHITNLQLINIDQGYPNSYTSFYALYESSKSGVNKIYYRVYNEDGLQDENELTSSTQDQSELKCNNNGRIVWVEQNKIMHSLLDKESLTFDSPVIIDSGSCSFPSIQRPGNELWWGGGFPAVAWIKEDNNNSHVMIRTYDDELGWLDPLNLFSGPEFTNLSYCNGIGPLSVLTWDYFNDTVWKVITYDLESSQMYQSNYSSNNSLFPCFLSGILMVKSLNFDVGVSSIVYSENGVENIYSAPFNYGPLSHISSYQNVSQTNNPIRNPALHVGEVIGCNHYFINTWEEFINNHWQIKYSISSECLSNTESFGENRDDILLITPNPVYDVATFTFSLEKASDLLISVYNMHGIQVGIVTNGELQMGKHQIDWNCNALSSGMYVVEFKSGIERLTKKLIIEK
jgi:type IX secretion system substrate protein